MAKKEASFRAWLQRVRRTGQFSDVVVRVEGEEFRLHQLPLRNASLFFRSAVGEVGRRDGGGCGGGGNPESGGADSGGSGASSSDRIIDLVDMPGGAEGFAMAADFCYLIQPTFTIGNIAKVRAVAQHLGMAELLDSTNNFMHMNVFSNWSSCAAFLLESYRRSSRRLHQSSSSSCVDEYVESRCVEIISSSAAKAFLETKYLREPISVHYYYYCRSSPCNVDDEQQLLHLSDLLLRIFSLPDLYVSRIVHLLVHHFHCNLPLHCRQARNVKSWLDAAIASGSGSSHFTSHTSRCWFVIAFTRMLQQQTRPACGLQLSSQYCCRLLYHAQRLLIKTSDSAMAELLQPMVCFLEERIGRSLHELDEDLLSYDFEPRTLISLVGHFAAAAAAESVVLSEEQVAGVAAEVDGCLWRLAEEAAAVSEAEFAGVVEAFPDWARKSHDMLYAGIEKMIATKAGGGERWRRRLWRLVDAAKLSPDHKERALCNAEFLSQPHVLEHVLRSLPEELLESQPDGSSSLRPQNHQQCLIVNQIVHASLKLLEENARRSDEIAELRRRYSALIVRFSKEAAAASTLSSSSSPAITPPSAATPSPYPTSSPSYNPPT